jgi:hypothetical protein
MTSGLDTVLAEREILKNAYLDVIDLPITSENLETFRELRLKIRDNRTKGIEKWHKLNKAFFLNGGRFVDAIKNKEIAINEDWEAKLLEAEKFFENQEKARIKALNDARIERLKPYLENVDGQDFSMMDDYDFDDFVEVKKLQFERKQEAERIERERIEAERLAEIERQKAIEAENAKLKAEAKIEAEKQAKIQAQLEKERAEAKAKQDAIQAEAERKAREEKAKQDAILAQERVEKQKLIDAENARLAEIEKQRLEAEKLAKASDSANAGADTSQDALRAQTLKDNPLYAILSPNISQGENGGSFFNPGPVVGFALAKDTGRVHEVLNMPEVKALFPKDVKFFWSVKGINEAGNLFELVTIKVPRDGKPRLTGEFVTDAR